MEWSALYALDPQLRERLAQRRPFAPPPADPRQRQPAVQRSRPALKRKAPPPPQPSVPAGDNAAFRESAKCGKQREAADDEVCTAKRVALQPACRDANLALTTFAVNSIRAFSHYMWVTAPVNPAALEENTVRRLLVRGRSTEWSASSWDGMGGASSNEDDVLALAANATLGIGALLLSAPAASGEMLQRARQILVALLPEAFWSGTSDKHRKRSFLLGLAEGLVVLSYLALCHGLEQESMTYTRMCKSVCEVYQSIQSLGEGESVAERTRSCTALTKCAFGLAAHPCATEEERAQALEELAALRKLKIAPSGSVVPRGRRAAGGGGGSLSLQVELPSQQAIDWVNQWVDKCAEVHAALAMLALTSQQAAPNDQTNERTLLQLLERVENMNKELHTFFLFTLMQGSRIEDQPCGVNVFLSATIDVYTMRIRIYMSLNKIAEALKWAHMYVEEMKKEQYKNVLFNLHRISLPPLLELLYDMGSVDMLKQALSHLDELAIVYPFISQLRRNWKLRLHADKQRMEEPSSSTASLSFGSSPCKATNAVGVDEPRLPKVVLEDRPGSSVEYSRVCVMATDSSATIPDTDDQASNLDPGIPSPLLPPSPVPSLLSDLDEFENTHRWWAKIDPPSLQFFGLEAYDDTPEMYTSTSKRKPLDDQEAEKAEAASIVTFEDEMIVASTSFDFHCSSGSIDAGGEGELGGELNWRDFLSPNLVTRE